VTDAQAMSDANANFGGTKMAITIGTSGVDYSDPAHPKFKGAVGFGGRGISIWEVHGDHLDLTCAPAQRLEPAR